jgi:AcrR family transcriptional regulator
MPLLRALGPWGYFKGSKGKRKHVFFEKKKQKTFINRVHAAKSRPLRAGTTLLARGLITTHRAAWKETWVGQWLPLQGRTHEDLPDNARISHRGAGTRLQPALRRRNTRYLLLHVRVSPWQPRFKPKDILTFSVSSINFLPMHISARIIRAEAEALGCLPNFLTDRERERRDNILRLGRAVLAKHGRDRVRFIDIAIGLNITQAAIRRHFVDLDALLGDILRRHCRAIVAELAKIPQDAPDRDRKRRAAYIAATRTPLGNLTADHVLLVRDRHLLPDDERIPLELLRDEIGHIVAGEHFELALELLDLPHVGADEIEAKLARQISPAPRPRSAPRSDFIPPGQDESERDAPGQWIYDAGFSAMSRGPPAAA